MGRKFHKVLLPWGEKPAGRAELGRARRAEARIDEWHEFHMDSEGSLPVEATRGGRFGRRKCDSADAEHGANMRPQTLHCKRGHGRRLEAVRGGAARGGAELAFPEDIVD